MKLLNADITYLYTSEEFDGIVERAYGRSLGAQPRKQRMRQRWTRGVSPWSEWCDHYRDNFHGIIERYIGKHIGQKYDDVYSKFLKDPRFKDSNMSDWHRPREIFNDYIANNSYKEKWCRWKHTYLVDSEGRIQLNPDRFKRNRHNKIYRKPEGERKIIYKVNKEHVIRLYAPLCSMFGVEEFRYLMNTDYISPSKHSDYAIYFHRHEDHAKEIVNWARSIKAFGFRHNKFYSHYCLYDALAILFDKTLEPLEEIPRGTKEYYIEIANIKKRKRQYEASRRHPDRSLYDFRLWYYKHPEKREVSFNDCVRYGSYEEAMRVKQIRNDKERSKWKDSGDLGEKLSEFCSLDY